MTDRIIDAVNVARRARIQMMEGAAKIQARNVQFGDRLDLEGDSIADLGNDPRFMSEFMEVMGAELETENCIRIDFDGFSCGFPVYHLIAIDLEEFLPNFYECGICGHLHPTGYTGDCRNDAFRFSTSELEDELGQQDVKWFLTDWQGRQLV